MKKDANTIVTTATTINKTLRLFFMFDIISGFHVVADDEGKVFRSPVPIPYLTFSKNTETR